MKIYEVRDRNDQLTASLLDIWERSVRATHLFLSDAEIRRIREYVPQAFENVEHLIVCEADPGKLSAFMGVAKAEVVTIGDGTSTTYVTETVTEAIDELDELGDLDF